ncbi:MAG: FAD-dependent oxidoreductase, partial [Planctomycetota bacterium]
MNDLSPARVLVIGAGVAGMTCARKRASAGQRVTVLDKGRRPGGRLATRVSREGPTFDQGAQFLTARSVSFQQQVAAWCEAGVVALWDKKFVDMKPGAEPTDTVRDAKRYVGVPKMASLVEHLCDTAALGDAIDGPHFETRVVRLESTEISGSDSGGGSGGGGRWNAIDEAGQTHGPFDRVVVAVPATQAHELLKDICPALAERLTEVETAPTWTAMLGFDTSLNLDPDYGGAFVENSPIGTVANQAGKPGRPAPA